MNGSDIFKSLFIVLIFLCLYAFAALSVGIKKIQEDWPNYRCNPSVMPFASMFGHDPGENFTYCIQTMQSDYMGYLMQPLNYNIGVLGGLGSGLMDSIQAVRAFINQLRNMITDLIKSVFGVFLNLLIEVQRIVIVIKDMVGKVVGIMATLMYTLDGSVKTMESTWAGPPGQMVRALSGLCFHPEQLVPLADGTSVQMSKMPLNSVLKNGARVISVMDISNVDELGNIKERLLAIPDGEGDDVLVTGVHLVYDEQKAQFVRCCNHPKAKESNVSTDRLSCLITSNHTIPIGKTLFHDWESIELGELVSA